MVELFAVRFVYRLIAECKSLHPVPPVARLRVPHASEVERAFTGTCTRIALEGAFTLSPSTGFAPALCHYGLRLPLQAEGLSLSPALGAKEYWIESPDYSPLGIRLTYNVSRPWSDYSAKPPSSTDKPLSWHPALRVGILADG